MLWQWELQPLPLRNDLVVCGAGSTSEYHHQQLSFFFPCYLPLFLLPAQYWEPGWACIWAQGRGKRKGKSHLYQLHSEKFPHQGNSELGRSHRFSAPPNYSVIASKSQIQSLLQTLSAFYKPYGLSLCEIIGIFTLQMFRNQRRFENKVRFPCLLWKSCFPFQLHLGLWEETGEKCSPFNQQRSCPQLNYTQKAVFIRSF